MKKKKKERRRRWMREEGEGIEEKRKEKWEKRGYPPLEKLDKDEGR